jgi:hypothetical protein
MKGGVPSDRFVNSVDSVEPPSIEKMEGERDSVETWGLRTI